MDCSERDIAASGQTVEAAAATFTADFSTCQMFADAIEHSEATHQHDLCIDHQNVCNAEGHSPAAPFKGT
jgi:hypothetical protein